MNNLKTLKDCCEFQEGYVNPSQKDTSYFGGNIKWLRASDLNGGHVYKTERTLSKRGYESAGKSAKLFKKGTLAISKSGTIGALGILEDEMCGNRAVINISVDEGKADLKYVFYTLKYKKEELVSKAGGSIQKNLYISALETLSLNHSLLEVQHRISSVLSAIDDKIEINNRINAELEAMAKTIYDYWFVQFDFPDTNGKPYKSSGGKMQYNATLKREIPEGWSVQPITDCCEIVDCLHSKKPEQQFFSPEYFLLQLENIRDDGLIDMTSKYFVSQQDYATWTYRIEVKKHDVVMTNAGRIAAFAQIPLGVSCGIGRNITAIRPHKIFPNYFFSCLSGFDIQRQILTNLDHGAFFKSFNVKGIKALKIVRPLKEIEKKFENLISPIIEKRHSSISENLNLSNLRDWLLPMLMNGQVTINSATQPTTKVTSHG